MASRIPEQSDYYAETSLYENCRYQFGQLLSLEALSLRNRKSPIRWIKEKELYVVKWPRVYVRSTTTDKNGVVPAIHLNGLNGRVISWDEAWASLFDYSRPNSTNVHPKLEVFTFDPQERWQPILRSGGSEDVESKGLRVKPTGDGVSAGTLLGLYEGWVGLEEEYQREASGTKERGFEEFAVEFEDWNFKYRTAHGKSNLLTTAYGEASFNILKYINDGAFAPLVAAINPSFKHAQDRPANARFVEVEIGGWPYLLVITIARIGPGEEVLFRYGSEYWQGMQAVLARHRSHMRRSVGASSWSRGHPPRLQ
ncbi:hypothetical protein CYMTET_28694, partial [Cymbomonas tetramitiformis]